MCAYPTYNKAARDPCVARHQNREDSAVQNVCPDYYERFHCIADRCRHNCCIGWEIDVDEDALAAYRTVGGEMGERCAGILQRTAMHRTLSSARASVARF